MAIEYSLPWLTVGRDDIVKLLDLETAFNL